MWVCISLLLSYLDIIGPTGSDRLTQGKVGTGEEVEFSGLDWVPPAQCITTTKTNNTGLKKVKQRTFGIGRQNLLILFR